jgi:hypothetical protein
MYSNLEMELRTRSKIEIVINYKIQKNIVKLLDKMISNVN